MQKGDIYTAIEVQEDPSGVLIRTDGGHLLGVVAAKDVQVGAKMQVGPVCGDFKPSAPERRLSNPLWGRQHRVWRARADGPVETVTQA